MFQPRSVLNFFGIQCYLFLSDCRHEESQRLSSWLESAALDIVYAPRTKRDVRQGFF